MIQNAGMREFGRPYRGEHLAHVAFPLGGIGAGMLCLDGTGSLSHVSLRHRSEIFNEPLMFAALCLKGSGGNVARVLEGPVPAHKPLMSRGANVLQSSGNGAPGTSYGLPRLRDAEFEARFPFATVGLGDGDLPIAVEITGWSPFVPGNADDSSLPVAALEYRLRNPSDVRLETVFSFHAANFMAERDGPAPEVREIPAGFVLRQDPGPDRPELEGTFLVALDAPEANADCRWFRGGWFDSLTMTWRNVALGQPRSAGRYTDGPPSPGGSVYVPCQLQPGAEHTIRLRLAWHVPASTLRTGSGMGNEAAAGEETYRPWYAAHFADVEAVHAYWTEHYERLRDQTARFADALHESTLPPEALEAVSANLGILRSPTVLRQADGRLWTWEGCGDRAGCCPGSCTHVWNYAQALPHLFPDLERTLRETEFGPAQDDAGHQSFRAPLPIRAAEHRFHAAADGQLGGVLKAYRDWRISGDTAWLRALWPRIEQSLDYAVETWDPDHTGLLVEPHHNTYDIEFWGPDSLCSSFYLGALRAAAAMAEALGADAGRYRDLYSLGRARLERELWNGEYFFQRVQWENLRARSPLESEVQTLDPRGYSAEAAELLQREGPKYQYGEGCLSDGVLGAWLAEVCGVGEILERDKVASHLTAVHRHNLRPDLSAHANPQRSGYAFGDEGGLLLCSWPRGGELSLPFVYSNEVWTGIEYQVAAHLIMHGQRDAGLEIVRLARGRYDGRRRNPFDEIECGHFYARALASFSLLQAFSGARYDAVDKRLVLRPPFPGDYAIFIATATGFGHAGVRDGEPFLDVRSGEIELTGIDYVPCP
jgi:uncharacterized protein (DUF608 family)